MGKLIDTSIFIEAERGRLELSASISSEAGQEFFMSVITVSELLDGVHRATAEFKRSRSATVEKWIQDFPVIDIDVEVARIHSQLNAEMRSKGDMIGIHDQWIGATCLANGLSIVTANVKDFIRIPGLIVENWSLQAQ